MTNIEKISREWWLGFLMDRSLKLIWKYHCPRALYLLLLQKHWYIIHTITSIAVLVLHGCLVYYRVTLMTFTEFTLWGLDEVLSILQKYVKSHSKPYTFEIFKYLFTIFSLPWNQLLPSNQMFCRHPNEGQMNRETGSKDLAYPRDPQYKVFF